MQKIRFVILACLLALGVLLAGLHNRAASRGQPFVVDSAIRSALAPFQSAMHSVARGGSGVAGSLRSRSSLLRDNQKLRQEVRNLSRENAKLREEHAENSRLRLLLGLKQESSGTLCAAQVIARGASPWHKTITIDRGWRDGVRRADPVITPRGLVGQTLDVSRSQSQVLLLTDQSSGVGAVAQRSRVMGVCQGQHTERLIMSYMERDADIRVGDLVVSSGTGGIYPKGLLIGRIARIQHSTGLQKSAEIRPSVQLDQVEEALVITGRQRG